MDTASTEDFIEDPAERIRQRADATLTRRLQDPQRLSPGSLVRVLFPVIEKHLAAGLTLEDIATALQEDGFAIKKTHLVRHLGVLRAENGLEALQRGVKAKIQPPPPPATDTAAPSTPTAGARKAGEPPAQSAAPTARPAPVAQPAPAHPAAPVTGASPAPFPDIPHGELTHTERSELAKRWIAAQFGDKHPTQVKPEELTPAAQAWLETLWDRPAPVNKKTGQPYAFKKLTPDGRLMYDNPWFPPEAVRVVNPKDENDYLSVYDAEVRDLMKKHGFGLHASTAPPTYCYLIDREGKQCSAEFSRDDLPCLGRQVRELVEYNARVAKHAAAAAAAAAAAK